MDLKLILKKSKLTYLFWGLFIVITICALFSKSLVISKAFDQYGNVIYMGGVIIAFILCTIVLLLISKIFQNVLRNEGTDISPFMETIILIFIFVFAFLIRFVFKNSLLANNTGDFHTHSF